MWIKRSEYEKLMRENAELRKLARVKDPKTVRYVKSCAHGGNDMTKTIECIPNEK